MSPVSIFTAVSGATSKGTAIRISLPEVLRMLASTGPGPPAERTVKVASLKSVTQCLSAGRDGLLASFPGVDAIHYAVEAQQHDEGDQKNDPTFQAVEESVRHFRADFFT